MRCPKDNFETENKKSFSNHARSHKRTTKGKTCNVGASNGMWRGDKVGYGALHDYIKCYLPKPEFCQNCFKKKAFDLANKSGEYKRNLLDWWWLCRLCHMTLDGRIKNLKSYVVS